MLLSLILIGCSILSEEYDWPIGCYLIVMRRQLYTLSRPNRDHILILGMKSLESKVAIVTGSSSGIGEAVAHHLASAGAKVALGARRKERLEELKAKFTEMGLTARYTVCDVTKPEQV